MSLGNMATKEAAETAQINKTAMEWKVYFRERQEDSRAGKEVPVNRQFMWDDEEWYIPSVYICKEGLVIDFMRKVPAVQIRAFMDKYHVGPGGDITYFTPEMQEQIDADNPLVANIQPQADLEGSVLKSVGSTGYCFNPLFPELNHDEVIASMQHYALDLECGWAFHRWYFRWNAEMPSKLTALEVTMVRQDTAIAGPHFRAAAVGDTVEFTHPLTNVRHTLTVREIEEETANVGQIHQNMEFPQNCVVMAYTLSPELPGSSIHVIDTAQSDRPRQKQGEPNTSKAATVLLGGVRGVSSVAAIVSGRGELHTACSALHFEAVKEVEWRIIFHEKLKEAIRVTLI